MEDLIPFLFMVGYLILRALGKFADKHTVGEQVEEGRPERERGYSVDDVLQELMGDLGMEQPVPEEHQRTASEHRRTSSEHRPTLTETLPTALEHYQTEMEIASPASEYNPTPSEHQLSWGEHLKGDLQPSESSSAPPATAGGGKRSQFGQSLVEEIRGGSKSLAKVMVLNEILGPPVSLRSGKGP